MSLSLFFKKNGTDVTLRDKARIANVNPAVSAGQVVTFEQAVLVSFTDTVTQASSITTGVTLNAKKGLITTFTPSTAGLDATTFTVTNSFARATGNIEAYIVSYGGTVVTNGVPQVYATNRTATGFDIVIYNAHATNALATSLVIGFEIKD